jgi:phosphoglycolate phosphatase
VQRRTHVLVDLDGTITDSLPAITGSLKLALTDVGLAVPSDGVLRSVVGPPFEVGLPAIGVPVTAMPGVIERYRIHYEGGGLFECTLYDGVVDMLDGLRASGHTLAMATAKPEPTAVRIIEHFGLTDRFAVLAGATYEPGRRTKGDVIAHAFRQLDVGAGPAVVLVGDRDHDVEGARDHGIDCIGALWGYGGEAELVGAGAWALAATPADVLRLVEPSECFDHPSASERISRAQTLG